MNVTEEALYEEATGNYTDLIEWITFDKVVA